MLFAKVCAGFICCCYEDCGRYGAFLAFWVLLGPHVYRTRVAKARLSLDTPFGRRSVEHSMVVLHVWYYGLRVHSGGIAGKFYVRPFCLLFELVCFVGTLLFGDVVWFFGIFGLVGLGIQAHPLVILLLRSSMWEGGSLMETWFLMLKLTSSLLLSRG